MPIAPELLPLLERMCHGARDRASELVVPVLEIVPRDTLAARTRGHLLTAGVVREGLHVSTVTTVRANFRSWRDSGLTWLAMIGVDATRIMRRAGHDDVATTMRYIKQAEDLGDALGEPFGALPRDLTS